MITDWLQMKQMFLTLINFELKTIQDYINVVEIFINNELTNTQKEFKQRARGLTKDEISDLYESYVEYIEYLGENFPNILRKSLFVFSYSFLEDSLNRLCLILQRAQGIEKSYKGNGIHHAKNYLKKYINYNFIAQSSSWSQIVLYDIIRNEIVHNDSRFEKKL
jgi:hypothetical protein